MGTAIEYCMICGNQNCASHTWTGMLPTRFAGLKQPYTCPNCDGYGNREKQHYFMNPTAIKCWSCDGTGVVWG